MSRQKSYKLPTVGGTGRVGFFGCAGGDRLVRVEFVGSGMPPRGSIIACPACGATHHVTPDWRPATPCDEGKVAEILIGAEGAGHDEAVVGS